MTVREQVVFDAATVEVTDKDVILTLATVPGPVLWAAATTGIGAVSWSDRRAVYPLQLKNRVLDFCRTQIGSASDELGPSTTPHRPTLVAGHGPVRSDASAELRSAQGRLRRLEEMYTHAVRVAAELEARRDRERDRVARLSSQS